MPNSGVQDLKNIYGGCKESSLQIHLETDYDPQICDYINQVEWLKGCE